MNRLKQKLNNLHLSHHSTTFNSESSPQNNTSTSKTKPSNVTFHSETKRKSFKRKSVSMNNLKLRTLDSVHYPSSKKNKKKSSHQTSSSKRKNANFCKSQRLEDIFKPKFLRQHSSSNNTKEDSSNNNQNEKNGEHDHFQYNDDKNHPNSAQSSHENSTQSSSNDTSDRDFHQTLTEPYQFSPDAWDSFLSSFDSNGEELSSLQTNDEKQFHSSNFSFSINSCEENYSSPIISSPRNGSTMNHSNENEKATSKSFQEISLDNQNNINSSKSKNMNSLESLSMKQNSPSTIKTTTKSISSSASSISSTPIKYNINIYPSQTNDCNSSFPSTTSSPKNASQNNNHDHLKFENNLNSELQQYFNSWKIINQDKNKGDNKSLNGDSYKNEASRSRSSINLKRKSLRKSLKKLLPRTSIYLSHSKPILHQNVIEEEFDQVKILIKQHHCKIDQKDSSGAQAIHCAASRNTLPIFKFLHENRARIDAHDRLQATPLHYAASSGSKEIVRYICLYMTNMNIRDHYGYTPFHLSIKHGHIDVAAELLYFGADINFKKFGGNTALHIACVAGSAQTVEFLSRQPNILVGARNESGETPLMSAVAAGRLSMVRFILFEAKFGRETMKLLDENGRTLLHRACQSSKLSSSREMILILRRANAKQFESMINTKDKNMFETPLHVATTRGDSEAVKILVLLGAEVNVRDIHNDTPLHLAARYKFRAIAIWLMVHGGKKRAKNNRKETPKQIAKHNQISLSRKHQI